MLKKSLFISTALLLSACSMTSPFSSKKVIDLDADKIDQKSYAAAYETTAFTYQGRVHEDYDVQSFASGANDWQLGRILLPIEKIKQNLFQENGVDSKVYAYYSGVLFAHGLADKFVRLNCSQHIDKPSITQGIYDAMQDLQKNKVRSENDPYLVKGSETLVQYCSK